MLKRHFYLYLIFYLLAGPGFGQTRKSASPEGGFDAFYIYVAMNLRYPVDALRNRISGKVYVKFTIDSTGKIKNPEAIQGPRYGLREEAVRLIQLGPKWNPMIRDGKQVNSEFKLPINFSMPQFQPKTIENVAKDNPNVTVLKLPGVGLLKVSSSINQLKKLKSLDLSGNDITTLPKEFSELENLKSVNLANNQIKEIPDALIKCSGIKVINLNNNAIDEVPKELFHKSQLKKLFLNNTDIKHLPDGIEKSGLKKLYIKNTPLSKEQVAKKLPNTKIYY